MPHTLPAPRSQARLLVLAVIGALLMLPMLVVAPVDAVGVETGFRNPVYGMNADDPTQDKPQSKVWYNDGVWWAGMYDQSTGTTRIWRLNGTEWAITGAQVDPRDNSHADYLWDGTNLHVVSVNGDSAADPIHYFRYNYSGGTYTLAAGPTQVGLGPSESVTIAKSGTNLWVTFTNPVVPTNPLNTEPRNVMVNRSTDNGATWASTTGTQLVAGTTAVTTGPDDISAIVAFGNAVGVMWTDQRTGGADDSSEFFFSANVSPGGATFGAPELAASGTGDFVDDHVNLKVDPSGRVLAAVKTNDGPDHIQLLLRTGGAGGGWSQHVVVGAGVDATRPQVVIDATTSEVYVLYTIPVLDSDAGDQTIYYKKAPLSTLAFTTTGNGTQFMADGTNDINNVSTTKQNVTSTTGLLAIASSNATRAYYHNLLGGGGGGPPPPPPPPGGGGHPFTDIRGHPFEADIVWLFNAGITSGCTATTFCPDGTVNREQMASFLARAFNLPAAQADFFSDDNNSIHQNDINRLAQSGIAFGCGAGRYCPLQVVNRQEMASFLARAFRLAPSATNFFTDDNGSLHEPDINRLAASGITGGCGGSRYCPLGPVTRGQMAAFLHRGLTR